jgi:ribosomal protein S4
VRRPFVYVFRVDQIRSPVKRKLQKPISTIKLDKQRVAAFYGYLSREFSHMLLRSNGLQGNFKYNMIMYLEFQLHIILWRTQLFRNISEIKPFIRNENVLINFCPVKSPILRPSIGDFISLKIYNPLNILNRAARSQLILVNHHILFSFATGAMVLRPIKLPLFFFFKVSFNRILFRPRAY